MQKLVTAEIKKASKKFPLYSQDGKKGQAVVLARYFTPYSNYTWYMLEFDPTTGDAFGYIVGPEPEYGYFNVNELQNIKHNARFMGRIISLQAIERDISIDSGKQTLEQILEERGEQKPSWWADKEEEVA